MKYQYGRRSSSLLSTCDERLQRVMHRALSYDVLDITVLEGQREDERQAMLFRNGKSKLDGVTKKSKHQKKPKSYAVDVAPYPIDWQNTLAFHIMAGLIFAAASEEGVKIRWGGSWDGKLDERTNSFHDLPHIELMED